MLETVTRAVVLDSVPVGEQDARLSLFTETFGKITARAKSIRKITSKLAGHLQPFNVVMVRLVEKGEMRVVDALTEIPARNADYYAVARTVDVLTAEGQPDEELWNLLSNLPHLQTVDIRRVLGILGFDPAFAKCNNCDTREIAVFSFEDTHFYCAPCARFLGSNIIHV